MNNSLYPRYYLYHAAEGESDTYSGGATEDVTDYSASAVKAAAIAAAAKGAQSPFLHVWTFGTCCIQNNYVSCGLFYAMVGSPVAPFTYSVYDPQYQAGNETLWQDLGSPSPGDFSLIYGSKCAEYLGKVPLSTYPVWSVKIISSNSFNNWPVDTNKYHDCYCNSISQPDVDIKQINTIKITNVNEFINPVGETRNVRINGEPGAVFTLTIDDSSGCTILEDEISDVSMPKSGSYSFDQKFPLLKPSATSETYSINLVAAANCKLSDIGIPNHGKYSSTSTPTITLYQYKNPVITFTSKSTQADVYDSDLGVYTGVPLTISGADITKTGPAGKFGDSIPGYGSTNYEVTATLTSGGPYIYITGDSSFTNNIISSTVIKKIAKRCDEETTTPTRELLLNPAVNLDAGSTPVNLPLYHGDIKKNMKVSGKISRVKTVQSSVGTTSCEDATKQFKLENTTDLFAGMQVSLPNGDVISSIDTLGADECNPDTAITLFSSHVIRDGTKLTFTHAISSRVDEVIGVTPKGETHINLNGSVYAPTGMELSFDDNETIVSGTLYASGMGSGGEAVTGAITLTAEVYVVKFGIADVTYTLDVDRFINSTPTAHDQHVVVSKGTATYIFPKRDDTDENAAAKTCAVVASPTNGTVGAFSTNRNAFVYTPHPSFTGEDSFTFRSSSLKDDVAIHSLEKTIYIIVK